jgi:hypothetical protein
MRGMEHAMAGQQPNVTKRTGAVEQATAGKTRGNRHFEQVILPGLGSGRLLPAAATRCLSRLLKGVAPSR